jgi:hypothetical protein
MAPLLSAEPQPAALQPASIVEGSASARAALCVHGRAGSAHGVRSLAENLATPLDADIFVLVNCESPFEDEMQDFVVSDCTQAAPPYVRSAFNASGRLVSFVSKVDSPDEQKQMELDMAPSASQWRRLGEFRSRTYMDLSNHLTCASMIHEHERSAGISYAIIAHSRLDIRYFTSLPPAIASPTGEWRVRAVREATTPHVFKPKGDDHLGVIDITSVANRCGFEVLTGVRDGITQGLRPRFASQWARGTNRGQAPVWPEQFTRSQLHAANATLTRKAWPHCREAADGSCRYPGEAARLLFEHMSVARAHPSTVCRSMAYKSVELISADCCDEDLERHVTGQDDTLAPPSSSERFAACTVLTGWKGWPTCGRDFGDPSCCTVASACRDLFYNRPESAASTIALAVQSQRYRMAL